MNKELSRRDFIARGTCAGCSLFMIGGSVLTAAGSVDNVPDPKEFTYCGYKCTLQCPMLKATKENDVELKKKTFVEWKLGERHGVEFDPEIIFCHGCKNNDMPKSLITENCSIVPCALEKRYDSCFQCKELTDCDKELWLKFPEHRNYVLDLQKNYFATLE